MGMTNEMKDESLQLANIHGLELTDQDKELIANFWDSAARKSLQKMFAKRQYDLSQVVITGSPNHEFTLMSRGAAQELDRQFKEILKIHKKVRASEGAK